MNDLVKAFIRWREAPMGSCCSDTSSFKSHWETKVVPYSYTKVDGTVIQSQTIKHNLLPDSKVCPRERAWRDYISLRDGVDHHVKV